jgi:rubrerythrin
MATLKGAQTEHSLQKAFDGESQARNRYTYFALLALMEGIEQITALSKETADNENDHDKRFFGLLELDLMTVTTRCPAGMVGMTLGILKDAADGGITRHAAANCGKTPSDGRLFEKVGVRSISAAMVVASKEARPRPPSARTACTPRFTSS